MDGTIVLKLILLLLINLAALGYLIFSFIKLGNSYQWSLRIAWDLIILGAGNRTFHLKVKGLGLIHRGWWLMLFLDCLVWVMTESNYSRYFILFLLLLHGYWYLHAAIHPGKLREQILFTGDDWGIIYREVELHSGLNQKSLAELDLRKKNLLVLAIERGGRMLPFPKGLEIIKPGDRILLFGSLSSYRMVNHGNGTSSQAGVAEGQDSLRAR